MKLQLYSENITLCFDLFHIIQQAHSDVYKLDKLQKQLYLFYILTEAQVVQKHEFC